MKRRLFKTMVAVLAIAAAAAGPVRGQNETLLTTVTATSLTTYSQSPDGIVTVSLNDIGSYAAGYGWLCNDNYTGIVTVEAAQGYTITRCVFKQNPSSTPNRVLEDDQAPFTATMDGAEYYVYAATTHGVAYGDDFMSGISTIEVYGYAPAAPQPHTVRMAEGTEEAANWSLASGNASVPGNQVLENVMSGSELTATYNGTQKVKSVKAVKYVAPVEPSAPAGLTIDLATVTEATTVEDGYTLTGTLGANVKISIADGATVTLDGVTINGVNNQSYNWAGINCLGDATIILSGTNTVKGFYEDYPGIHVPVDKTLTIQGSGSLTASSRGFGCGIGGGNGIACGNIVIAGGTITANGGGDAAGIGSGLEGSCGNISITGGTITANDGGDAAGIGSGNMGSCGNISITGGNITATGSYFAAGIGSGKEGQCGNITITNGVTSVTATKGNEANYSIGFGSGGLCGTVTIGGTVGAIETSPYTYTPGN